MRNMIELVIKVLVGFLVYYVLENMLGDQIQSIAGEYASWISIGGGVLGFMTLGDWAVRTLDEAGVLDFFGEETDAAASTTA